MRTFIILIIFMSCCFAAEPEPLPLPGNAQAAVDKFDAAKNKAEADAARIVGKERDKLVSELNKLMIVEGKRGNVDGVVAIKAKMNKMQAESTEEARLAGTDLLGNKIPFKIISAKYGADRAWMDCTEIVKKAVKKDRLEMSTTDIHSVIGDPAPFRVKQVVIEYIINGENKTEIFPENTPIRIPKS